MRKYLLVVIILFGITHIQGSMLVDVPYSPFALERIMKGHFDIAYIRPKCCIKIIVRDEFELDRLKKDNLNFRIEIKDLEKFYSSRLNPALPMGGYHRYSDVLIFLDSLHNEYPLIVSEKESIGYSVEGRGVYCVKISDNPELDEDEPKLMFDALIHAREPLGMEVILYFMRYLTENYERDQLVRYIVNERELYFIPVLNPDGYVYNEITNPYGGGLWRKNRRINPDGSFGVDLNRNFGFMWGIDDYGSSPTPADETYRGSAPFSEPETDSYRSFVVRKDFSLIINNHTFGGWYLYPWGYTTSPSPSESIFKEYARVLARFSNYIPMEASRLYLVNGNLVDWAFGDTTEKQSIIAFSPELGSPDDGFWPTLERIEPNARLALKANLFFALIAGGYVKTFVRQRTGVIPAVSVGDTGIFELEIRNIGLDSLTNLRIYPRTLDSTIFFTDDTFLIPSIPSFSSVFRDLGISVSERAEPGARTYFEICAEYDDGFSLCDTHFIYIGIPRLIFFDDFEGTLDSFRVISGPDWERGSPTVGPSRAYSGRKCWGTIIDGPYRSYSRSILRSPRINLSGVRKPVLLFRHWYESESCEDTIYDGGFVRIKTGTTTRVIEPVDNYRGTLYSLNPFAGTRAFGGLSDDWETAYFDLFDFINQTIEIEFIFASDYYTEYYGWYIDDVAILDFQSSTNITETVNYPEKIDISLFPNPTNDILNVKISSSFYVSSISVVDIMGRKNEIIRDRMLNEIKIDLSDYSSGIYFLVINSTNGPTIMKKFVLLK